MTSIFLLHIGSLSLEWEGALRDSLPQSLHSQPYELPWRVPTASLTLEPSQGSTKKTICFFCQSVSTEERKGHRCQEEKTGVANAESSHGFYECELDMSTNQKSVLQCSRPWSRPGWEKKTVKKSRPELGRGQHYYTGEPEGTQPSPADAFQVSLQNHLSSNKITGGLLANGE